MKKAKTPLSQDENERDWETNNNPTAARTETFAPRIALMNSFYRAAFHRYIYASAPAGSGKTVSTLLWLAESGRKAVWISLNESDNTSTNFYKQFAFSLASAQPDNEEISEIIKSPSFSSTPIAHVLRLLKAFRADDEMYALVFDDIHHIHVPVVLRTLAAILQMLPASFVVLFLSREKPPEYLRELIKPAAVIKPEQFLFTEDEIRRYFESLGCPISPNEAKVVHTSTSGLPIGVSTVVKTGEIKLGQENFDSASFLTCQLLNGWSRDIQVFMQKTCVADEITPDLANRLTGGKDGKTKLDWLYDTNAYITKIGENTYRYHKMFLDLLRSRAGSIEPSVYKTVGDYYLERGELYTALSYYIRSGAFDDIAPNLDLILRYSQPSFSVIELFGNTMRIDIESMSERIETAGGIKLYFYIWCLWKHYVMGDVEIVHAYFDKLNDLVNNTSHPVVKNLVIAVNYLDVRKKLTEIQREGENAVGAGYIGECHDMHMYTLNMYTMNMPFVSRSSRDASEYADDIKNIEDIFSDAFRRQMGTHYALYVPQLKAEIYYEMNLLAKAESEAASVSVPELWDKPDYVFSHYMTLASIAFALGRTKEAMQAFYDMEAYIKDNGCEYLLPNFLAIKVKLMLFDADKDAAQMWLNYYFVTEPVKHLLLYEIFRYFTTARAYIVLGRYSDALDLLEKLKRLGTDLVRPLDVAEAGVLQAIVEWAEGKKNKAVTLLEETLTVTQAYGFVRIIASESGSVMPVLKRLASKVGRQTYNGVLDRSYVNEVSVAANQFAKLHTGIFADVERNVKILKLSKRQKQVLSLMSKGYKNECISQEMGLDIMTVRGHQTKAYQKLGVHTGIEAVFKAREMGIVE